MYARMYAMSKAADAMLNLSRRGKMNSTLTKSTCEDMDQGCKN